MSAKPMPKTYRDMGEYVVRDMRAKDCSPRFLYVTGCMLIDDELYKDRLRRKGIKDPGTMLFTF